MIRIINEILDDDLLECFDSARVELMDKYMVGEHMVVNYMMWSSSKERMMQINIVVSCSKDGNVVIDANHNRDLRYINEEDKENLEKLVGRIKEQIENTFLTIPKWRIGIITGAITIKIKRGA